MKWLEKETANGVLKYRMPDISEGYFFLAEIEQMKNAQDIFKCKGTFIKMMGDMILFKELGYSDYKEFLSDRENNEQAMNEIVSDVFDTITRGLAKKS